MTSHYFGADDSIELRWYHHVSDFANILKAFVGTNYLSLAYGFQQAGIALGIIGLVFVALLTDHCCQLLIKVKYLVVDQFCDQHMFPARRKISSTSSNNSVNDDQIEEFAALLRYRMQKNLSYPDLGRILFGNKGAIIVNIFLLITQFGFCMNYFIFMGNILYSFLPAKVPVQGDSGFFEPGFNQTTIIVPSSTHLVDTIHPSTVVTVPTALFNLNQHNVSQSNSSVLPVSQPSVSTNVSVINIVTQFPQNASTTALVTERTSSDNSSSQPDSHNATNTSGNGKPHQGSKIERKGPSLALMVLLPTPLCIAFTLFRDVRRMGPISAVANLSVICGSLAVLIYILSDFSIAEDVVWFKFITFSVFLGQVTASYEGIGTIMSIEGSMEGNRHCFGSCLHGAIVTFTVTLFTIAIVGYLKFGEATEQILIQNLPIGDAVTVLVNITLLIGVLCTYPLQVFPVVTTLESTLFSEGGMMGPAVNGTMEDESDTDEVFQAEEAKRTLLDNADSDINKVLPVAKAVPRSIPTWKRNMLRVVIALFIAAMSVLMRNVFAYVGAFVGAVGSCPLAFILPSLFHYKLARHNTSPYVAFKDMIIIIIGGITAVVSFLVVTSEIIHRL